MNKNIECIPVGDLETNCWLYAAPDLPGAGGPRPCVVIDPGDDARLITARLGELNWIPRYIFLTHGHFDHLAALPDLLEALRKSVWRRETPAPEDAPQETPLPVTGIHRLDAAYVGKNALAVHRNSFAAAGGNPAYVDALWKALPEAGILFEEGDSAGPFTVLHIPGHTPGSAGFYDEKNAVLFSGDTLFRGTWGRTDLPGGSPEQMRQSLKRLLSMKKEITVCPGHGAATTIGEEAGNLWPEIREV